MVLRFQISEKWANLRFSLNIQKQKVFQLQGASPPDSPTRGSATGPRWRLRPQTPVIGSRFARSPCSPLPNPEYATECISTYNPVKRSVRIQKLETPEQKLE